MRILEQLGSESEGLFQVLGSRTRLKLLELLARQKMNINEPGQALGIAHEVGVLGVHPLAVSFRTWLLGLNSRTYTKSLMKMRRLRVGLRTLPALAAFFLPVISPSTACAQVASPAQVFHVDFSRWEGPPLIKTKFGVYQTPFLSKSDLQRAATLLPEAGVQDLRYEMGWGKPDTYAFDQIRGTAANPVIDFSALDPFVLSLKQCGVTPLFAMTYDPLPLKTGTDWQRWKDVPANLAAWQEIQRRYTAHYRQVNGLTGPYYELWNEPDLPGDGGKVFFNGSPSDYADVYRAGAAGIRAGDSDALVGGPAIAYDQRYAQFLQTQPSPSFASVHAYANYAEQLTEFRALVKDRAAVPLFLTEYASYTHHGPKEPISRFPAAARFFQDVKELLTFTDVPKVYWAQWVDDSLGMVTRDFHRKALFNAYTLYQTRLPVDRSPVTPDGAGGLGLLAASDDHTAGVAVWNESATDKTATVHLGSLPFENGRLRLYRIDASHASYVDNPAAEMLSVSGDWKIRAGAEWTGTVPAQSVVFLYAFDGSGISLLRPRKIGTVVGQRHWFPERRSSAYADFDPHTSIIRIGEGAQTLPVQTGIILDRPAAALRVQVTRCGPFAVLGQGSLFGLRVDYGAKQGGYARSVLWHDGTYRAAGSVALPWGKEGTQPDQTQAIPQMNTGQVFMLNIAGNAPGNWSGRIILTPILRNRGTGSCARILLEAR